MVPTGLSLASASLSASDGLTLLDVSGRFREANAALCRWLSHVAAPAHATVRDLIHPDDYRTHARSLAQVLDGTCAHLSFTARVHPARPAGWLSLTFVAMRQAADTGTAALLAVCENRLHGHALNLQAQLTAVTTEQERLQLALNGSDEGLWDWYPQRGAVYVSARWKALLGDHSRDFETTVEGWRERIHADDLPILTSLYRQHVMLGTPVYEVELRMRHASGEWIWVVLRGQVSARSGDGTPERVTGTIRDVTAHVRARQDLQRTQDHLQAIMNAVPGLIGYKDLHLRHQYGNSAYQDWYGRTSEDMRGLHIREVIGEDMYRQNEAHMLAALSGEPQRFESSLTDVQGQTRRVLFSYVPDTHADGVRGLFVLAVDITSRHHAEQALMEEREWGRTTLNSIGDGVITTDPHGRVTFINPVAQALTGWDAAQSRGQPIEEVMHLTGAGGAEQPNPLLIALNEQKVVGMAVDTSLTSRGGQMRVIADSAAPIRSPDGRLLGGVIVFHDVSEARAMAVRMSHLAQHDALTDLPNRVLLQDRVQQAVALYRRSDRPFALIFMDLDHFKHVNDTLGHHVGDELLLAVARRLKAQVRETDTVCRQGGDEFVLLLTDLRAAADVQAFTNRLETCLAEPYHLGEHVLNVTFSIGIAMCPHDGSDVDTLLRHADAAMYQAKAAGRRSTRFFSPGLLAQIEHRHRLSMQLRDALHAGEFALHYQPKVNPARRQLSGVEALLRWTRPDGTQVTPAEFIPVAEESGLIIPLGQWVLSEACAQARAWELTLPQPVPVAVNISSLQFDQPDFTEQVRAALRASALSPTLLELEITESVLVTNPEQARARLSALRDMGVRLSIDDFGTGFSSLSYLKLFPVDMLKIDRSFVRDVDTDRNDVAIVAAVLGIGQALNLEVLAEGVETERQVETLLKLGCTAMQGYHFARPMPPRDMTAWLGDWLRAPDAGTGPG